MILKSDRIADRLASRTGVQDPLVIIPLPSLEELRSAGSGSIDLRLGTWFVTLRQSRSPLLDITEQDEIQLGEDHLTKKHYIPFGGRYILHPRNFVLGATLEWLRLPKDLAGYVVGKSSWGRRGLVIATATGVHPGFAGCLTLELTNLGEMPIAIKPGMRICQLCLHTVDSNSDSIDITSFACRRRPTLGSVRPDAFVERLVGASPR